MKKTITINETTWKELNIIKLDESFKTIDGVISELLARYKENNGL